MKKGMKIVNWIFLALLVAGGVVYFVLGNVWVKVGAGFLFILLSLVNLTHFLMQGEKGAYPFLVLVGLLVTFFGNALFTIQPVIGLILVSVGQVILFAGAATAGQCKMNDIIFALAFFLIAALVVLIAPCFEFEDMLTEILCLVMMFAFSLPLGKAVTNRISKKKLGLDNAILVGSVLLFVSGVLALLNGYSSLNLTVGALSLIEVFHLATYFGGAFCFAHSVLYAEE